MAKSAGVTGKDVCHATVKRLQPGERIGREADAIARPDPAATATLRDGASAGSYSVPTADTTNYPNSMPVGNPSITVDFPKPRIIKGLRHEIGA